MTTDWTIPEKSMDGVALTWAPGQFGTPIDLGDIHSEFVVQYVVDYQIGDNFLVALETSIDGAHWTDYSVSPYVGGYGLAAAAVAAGTGNAIVHVTDTPARFVRASGDNRNTGGSPVVTALIAAAK